MTNTNTSHNQKRKKYRNLFSNWFSKSKSIFGVPLCDASKLGTKLWELKVPSPVAICFEEITKRGLTTEGIFRLSGSASEVNLLKEKLDTAHEQQDINFDASQFDIHTLASLVKKYLRELPEPVIPVTFHDQFQYLVSLSSASSILVDEQKYRTAINVKDLVSIILQLPYYHRQLLHAILLMTAQVQHHVKANKMCPEALATVLAPVCTGFEQSLLDHTATTFRKRRKRGSSNNKKINILEQSSALIAQQTIKNKQWTLIWKAMIEQHESLIAILDKHMYQQEHQPYQFSYNSLPSFPSPFSTGNSHMLPTPNQILMAQFYPISNEEDNIKIAKQTASHNALTLPTTADDYIRGDSDNNDSNGHMEADKASEKSSTSAASFFFQKSSTLRRILSASTLSR
ncbi:Rho GTPase activation protein [Mycotypha africana]|uniref:Rho GTPase activation protein n=1 Tax=Mycotypha africana TaxID=64632 RepID=UPI002301EC3B|nr:Rho GTPase activation protein [Mycotypha africana]KAI8987581.1 Rho GTPase activation protein [Mycotypha africana]